MCLKLLPAILLLHVGFVAVLLLAESYGGAVTATQPSMGLLNMTVRHGVFTYAGAGGSRAKLSPAAWKV